MSRPADADPVALDLRRLRKWTATLEDEARSLAWAKERPWRRETHLWVESGLPVVDLHDLDVRLARQLAQDLDFNELQGGAICFITGRGKHSVSGRSALREAVSGVLQARAQEEGWQLRPAGAGRLILVTDGAMAPAHTSGRLSPVFWLGVVAFLALASWLCLGAPGR